MLIFADIETTGLDEHKGSILEIALVATDDNLVQIGEPFVSLVKPLHMCGYEVMDDYVREMHTKSGLLEQIYNIGALYHGEDSSACLLEGLPRLGDVERSAIEWLAKIAESAREPGWADLNCGAHYEKYVKQTPLAGNSVHFDKAWLRVHMDDLEKLFSHRIYDVSALNEFAKRHAPEIYAIRPGLDANGKSVPKHRALDDVYASIETAKHYRSCFQHARVFSNPLGVQITG